MRCKLTLFFISFFYFIFTSVFADFAHVENSDFHSDNPWLCLTAICQSYPDIAGNLSFDTKMNDWSIEVRGVKLYWASGRLLKKEDVKNKERWAPHITYFYKERIVPPALVPDSLKKILTGKNFIRSRKKEAAPNYTFLNLVYEGKTKKQILRHIRRIKFLGRTIAVHKRIAAPLYRVEKKIYKAGAKNKKVKIFLRNLGQCWGFNWRVIADSGKISNHSWGSAVDIVPKFHNRVKTYWYWEYKRNKNWFYVKPSKRWSPPAEVIKIFESEGFIWGGKWELWDNMHFEYKPELLYIQDFVLANNVFKHPSDVSSKKIPASKDSGVSKKDSSIILTSVRESLSAIKIINSYVDRLNKKNDFTAVKKTNESGIEEDS